MGNGALLIYTKLPALLIVSGALMLQPILTAQEGSPAPAVEAVPAAAPIAPASAGPARAILPGEPGSKLDKRIGGVFPNYRTANLTEPFIPLTVGQKWKIATKDTFDYPSYVLASVFSGISQARDSNPGFGEGVEGYIKRYGAGIADQDMGNFMTEAVFPTLLHEDPRYFRKATGSVQGRIAYAVERVVVSKTDSGKWNFNFAEWLGNGTVASIGNLYYPNEKGYSSTMQRLLTQVGTDALSDILKEFWPDIKRHFGKKKSAAAAAD